MQTKRIEGASDGVTRLADAMDREHARDVHEELLLQHQRDRFDFETQERAELEREYNTLRDMMLQQMKTDDEVVKKYIAMI